jgi:gentisate 1,2-dioxygenase
MIDDGMVDTVDRVAEMGRSEFYARASSQSLAPLWRMLHGLVTELPRTAGIPHVWHYAAVRPYLMEACEIISTQESQRRVLILENPELRGQSRITRSLFAGLQVLAPGDIAPAHRHVASALRFIIEGTNSYTSVAGERTMMEPGDFVITPSWTWHDHGSLSDAPMVWLDGLDMHIVNAFDASFREDYPGASYPVTRREGDAEAEFGSNMAPFDAARKSATTPIFNYRYQIARESLHRMTKLGAPDPHSAHKMRYVNPTTGGDAMPTMTTAMQLIPKGFKTAPYRSTAGTVFVVVEGTGVTTFGERRMTWGPRDIFVAPSWNSFQIEASSDAVIFSYSDRVVQEKLDFFREVRGKG